MQSRWLKWCGLLVTLLMAGATVSSALGEDETFSTLYTFQAPAPNTFTSDLGSQPDTRPVLGPGNTVYGMTFDGGVNGNGVVYRFDRQSHAYTVLHTFGALDADGHNEDGATPGVALTRGPDDVFYGMASFGGANGNGTVFKITASGEFTVLHAFTALDTNLNNEDGANPLRTVVIGKDGNLYGTTRRGGQNICNGNAFDTGGCGVAWTMDRSGNSFRVLHQFTASEGHAASIIQASDGRFYGSAVWPNTSTPTGAALPSGTLFRMKASGQDFEVLYRFSQTDASGANSDGADPYEPLVEATPGVFYGAATLGGANSNGAIFRYSLSKPGFVEIVHSFGRTASVNAGGFVSNSDGAHPSARLTPGHDGTLYSTTSDGGANSNGVVYRIRNGNFEVLRVFGATDPVTGSNTEGAVLDYGVVLGEDNILIGIAVFGGNGSSAGFFNSGGTLYQLKLDD